MLSLSLTIFRICVLPTSRDRAMEIAFSPFLFLSMTLILSSNVSAFLFRLDGDDGSIVERRLQRTVSIERVLGSAVAKLCRSALSKVNRGLCSRDANKSHIASLLICELFTFASTAHGSTLFTLSTLMERQGKLLCSTGV